MKKALLTLIIVLTTLSAHTQITYTASFSTNDLSIDTIKAADNNIYTKVKLANNYDYTEELGRPELPTRTIRLIIPFGQVVSNVNVTNIQTQSYYVKHHVYPVDSCGILEHFFIPPYSVIYGSSNVYPLSPIVDWDQDYFDGNNIVTIIVCPFEYYPSSSLLKQITSITINISYSVNNQNVSVPLQRLQHSQELYDSILYHMVDNPLEITNYQTRPTIVDELGQVSNGLPVYEYVVVAPQVFEPSLHDFVNWKRQKGYRAGIVNIEDVLNAYPNGDQIGSHPIEDAAGSLRQYLHDAYLLGTTYAFLVGDPNSANNSTADFTLMPYRYGCINDNPDLYDHWFSLPTTDWYFSDLTGDWNVDEDEFYGERAGDAPSYNADIIVGRLICTTTQDINNWVDKLLIYEKYPGNGNAGYVTKSLVTLADHCGSSPYWENLPDFSHTIMEEIPDCTSPNPTSPLGSSIISRLNNDKFGLWTWFNHGGTNTQHSCMLCMTANIDHNDGNFSKVWKVYSDSLCIDNGQDIQPDTYNSLDYMTNNNEPSIIYAVSCHVIPFDLTKSNSLSGSRNCGESFTVGGRYGGVAFLGNTLDAFRTGYYLDFATTLNSVSGNNTISHLGILETQSKHYSSNWREHHYKHNLIGDPECQIWTSIPTPLQFDNISPSAFIKEVTNSVEIHVSGFNNYNSNCTVTLYSENDVFRTISVPINEQGIAIAVFDSIFPVSTTPISVTATCYNHFPVQTYIAVTEECQLNIMANETWSGNRTIDCDIIVHEYATLTITGNVFMNENNKIKVLPGGTLVLDGGKLSCSVQDHQWQGVRVLGTGSGSWQGSVYGHYSQGYVCLKNNAEINEARVAIDLWDGINYSSTGGIAAVSNASFRNNGMSIRALCFNNQYPINGIETAYNAHVYNCSFLIDEDYPTEGVRFQHHICLFRVRGVILKGCDFSIQNCPEGMSDETNCAVFIHDGGCQVDEHCNVIMEPCPEANNIKTYFRGFTIGINAINDIGYNSTLTVKNSVFLNNMIGIRTLNAVNTTVLFSEFFVGYESDCGVGIYLEKTPDFCIEENSFMKSLYVSQNINCFGIVADNTNSSNDIYRNSFSNLDCANYAKGFNRNSLDEGLTYSCNDNCTNNIDFYVPSINLMGPNYGISLYQGSNSISAGNTFSQSGVQWQIFNGALNPVSYYYDSSNSSEEPQDVFSYNVRKLLSIDSNECASNYNNSSGNDNPVLPPIKRQQRETDYYNSYINYYGVKSLFENHIDGGNTNNELSNISTATSENMWELRSELLGLSPYLSQKVLLAFVDRDDIFPQSVIFEVLASNPEELSRDSLLSIVEENSTLPEYMIAVLNELAKGTGSYRSVLESQMSMYKHNYYRAAKDIVRSIMNDTIIDMDDLRGWLGNMENISADRQIIASYLEKGNDSIAFALARMLPSLYGLTGDFLTEYNGYLELLTLYDTLYHQGRTVYEMTTEEKAIVDSLRIYGTGSTSSLAKSIYEAANGTSVIDCPEFVFRDEGFGEKGYLLPFPNDLNKNTEFCVSLSPNPAKTWTEVNYILPVKMDFAKLFIYTTLGNCIIEYDLIGNIGQKVIDLRRLSPGIYTYAVHFGKQMCTGKLVIIK